MPALRSSYSPQSSVPSYDSPSDTNSSPEFSSSSTTTPPPFYPGDQPPPYNRFPTHDFDTKHSHVGLASRVTIAHPYARLYAKKEGAKRRKIWNHTLEKSLFSPHEL
jgi:hypothetical protein